MSGGCQSRASRRLEHNMYYQTRGIIWLAGPIGLPAQALIRQQLPITDVRYLLCGPLATAKHHYTVSEEDQVTKAD